MNVPAHATGSVALRRRMILVVDSTVQSSVVIAVRLISAARNATADEVLALPNVLPDGLVLDEPGKLVGENNWFGDDQGMVNGDQGALLRAHLPSRYRRLGGKPKVPL